VSDDTEKSFEEQIQAALLRSQQRGARGSMTPEEIRNERRKLVANWCNTLATAVLTAGLLVPAAQFIFGVLPAGADMALVYGTGGVCAVAAVGIHFVGHMVLRGLE
jgi:Flp pilus assembly protein TadB